MGSTLSSPVVEKRTESGSNKKFAYGISDMQGWRISMEDAHAVQLDLDSVGDAEGDGSNAFFAVYDGHGGGGAAKYAGRHVHQRLLTEETYKKKDYKAALKCSFLGTDEDLLTDPEFIRDGSGCTAVAALVTNDNRIFVANAGDSRSVLSVKGEVKPLSFDHKPGNDTERTRIIAAGGYIEFGRVNGNLSLARALGDFDYKRNKSLSPEAQIVTCDPEITEHQIDEDDEFIILACDGIWDCLTSQQVVDSVRLLVSQGHTLAETCELIMDHCMAPDTTSGAGIGCDNMTILIVALLHGRTEEEWYQWIKDRVAQKHGQEVPDELPRLYSPGRLISFKNKMKAEADRERSRKDRNDRLERDHKIFKETGVASRELQEYNMIANSVRMVTAEMFGASGRGHPATSGVCPPSGSLLDDLDNDDFEQIDDEASDSDDDSKTEVTPFSSSSGIEHLKDEVSKLQDEAPTGSALDEDPKPQEKGKQKELQGEAPPSPKPLPNGDAKQLTSVPGGDAPSDAVRVEGLMDTSESPLKV